MGNFNKTLILNFSEKKFVATTIITLFAASLLFLNKLNAQCTYTVASSTSTICKGDSVQLKVIGNTTNVAGQGILFDGIDDQITLNATTRPSNTFTVEAWFKTSVTHEIDAQSTSGVGGTMGQKYLFGATFGAASDAGMGISVGTNGISVYEHASNYMPALAVYSGTLSTSWNHVAIVYTNKTPSIYLNGALVKTGLTSPRANVYAPIEIGGGAYGFLNGTIDEVRIWNIARTQTEISANMSRALVGNEPGLVTYLRMDEGIGLTTTDATGKGNTGTLQKGASWVASTNAIYPVFSWSPTTSLNPSVGDSVIAKPLTTTTYKATASVSCSSTSDSITITVNSKPVATITGADAICSGKNAAFTTSGGTSYLWNTGATDSSITITSTIDTTLKVKVSNSCGSDSTSKTITVNANPATPTITKNGLLLTSSAATGNQWYRNDTLLAGATNQTYTASINGKYTVVVSNTSGCSSSSSILDVNTSIFQIESEIRQFQLSPNPSNGKIELSFYAPKNDQYQIEIINYIGQVVYSEKISEWNGNYSKSIDLEHLKRGIYLISLKSSNNQLTKRLVIE